jgi:hypothetical protein
MTDEHGYPEGFEPQLGLLPKDPARPVLMLPALAVALPAPPLEVHNLELISDPDMLGNNVWGNCVFAGIENDRRTSRAALGLPLEKLTATQVVENYKNYTGATTPPGPGASIQLVLEWVRKYGWPGSADKLLVFSEVTPAITPIDQTVSEFHSGIFGVEIDASEAYPSSLWNADNTALRGYHATAAGTYDRLYTFCKTWGYLARMTPSYVAGKLNGFYVLVWDFEWKSLTYERQVQLVTDYQALTQKTWIGPAPVPPLGANVYTGLTSTRVADSRIGAQFPALTKPPKLQPGLNVLQIWGLGGVPSGATDIACKIEIISPTAVGWVEVGPTSAQPKSSVNWFPADSGAHAMNFIAHLSPDGKVYIWLGSTAAVDWDFDVRGFFTP